MTTTKPKVSKGAIQLNYSDGMVTVIPEDEDRFIITAQKAVKACRTHDKMEQAVQVFKQEFLKPLHDWCDSRSSNIDSCFLAPPFSRHMEVFVVTRSPKFDFELAKEISSQTIEMVDRGWMVTVIQIPQLIEEEVATFFHKEESIQVYAQLQTAPS